MDNGQEFRTPAPQCSVVVHEDIVEAENIEPKCCPLCNSKVRLYQIHFNEAFLMCGNINCVYPFGVSDYHVYRIECNDEFVAPEYRSIGSASITGSTLSQSDWSELDKYLPNSEHLFSPRSISPQPLIEKPFDLEKLTIIKKSKQNEEKIKKDVQKITELNKELFEFDDSVDCINNTKWLQSIALMQERSGVQLLKQNELRRMKTTIPEIGAGELKIDIDSTRNVISVQIENQNLEGNNFLY